MKKRWSSLLLCAAMLFSLCAPAAAVEDGVSFLYCDESGKNWKTGTCSTYKVVTEDTDEWEDSWYVAEGAVKIGFHVHVRGNVHLILKDGCELEPEYGITVHEGASLTIYAQSDGEKMGKLTARYSGSANAGIDVSSGSTITINGGEVTASGDNGAGIGGADGSEGGTIIINGGTVNASGNNGAGIGGGKGMSGGTVTINGGTVTATSSKGGAGIGGGIGGGAGGTITINGGTVMATSKGSGAGIGGGMSGAGGKITISGGTVTAAGSTGAGIGGGDGSSDGGSFSTETNGSAFITVSSIADQSKSNDWSGVIFVGRENGKVYGGSVTLTTDAEVPSGRELEIEADHTLTIGEGVTLTNNGAITGNGTIINNGTITGNEIDSGITTHTGKTEWSSDSSGHWHECALEGCTESHQFGYADHTFGEWTTDKEATADTAGSKSRTCNICQYTETQTIPATGGSSGGSTGGSGGGGDSSTPTYKPDVPQPSSGGGTPGVTPSRPERGDTVTVTPKPDEGYEVDGITVTDKNGKSVEVKANPDGTFSFTQPAGRATIEVTYKAAEPAETPWNNSFADVSEGAWYYEAVRFVCERGLMNGYADGRFAPEDTLSRAQLAQILYNKEGRPAAPGGGFADVTAGRWYASAVTWAAESGIVSGYGDGLFGPNDPITREQLAVMLWRYAGSPAPAGGALRFSDADEINPYAREAMQWAVENGILNGSGGQLAPAGQASRAQTAQLLKNFVEETEDA